MRLFFIDVPGVSYSAMFICVFIFKLDLDVAVAGRYDNWLGEFVYLLGRGGLGGFSVAEVVGNVYINILMGIDHPAYYYAGVKFKTFVVTFYHSI
jgi:hypothetical protein